MKNLLANSQGHWRNLKIINLHFLDGTVLHSVVDCESIEPYSEPGEMGYTIWFQVKYNDGRFARFNGSHLQGVEFDETNNS